MLLGEQDGRTWFAVVVEPGRAPGEKAEWFGLRGLLPHLAGGGQLTEAPLVFHAIGLAEWLYATRFCPRCARRPRGAARPATSWCARAAARPSSRAPTRP